MIIQGRTKTGTDLVIRRLFYCPWPSWNRWMVGCILWEKTEIADSPWSVTSNAVIFVHLLKIHPFYGQKHDRSYYFIFVSKFITMCTIYISGNTEKLFWWESAITYCISSVVPNPFDAIPPLEVPPTDHFPCGQWVPVDSREALNGKNNSKIFLCCRHPIPPKM